MTRRTGATKRTITRYSFFLMNLSPFFVTSSIMVSGVISQPMRIQVAVDMAGIIRLLLR